MICGTSCALDSNVQLRMVYFYSLPGSVTAVSVFTRAKVLTVIVEGDSRLFHKVQLSLKNVMALLLFLVLMLVFLQCTLSYLLFAVVAVRQVC